MKAETTKILDKLRVKLVVKEVPCMPTRGLFNDTRAWRTTLIRKVGRGTEAKEVKLATISILEGTALTGEPSVNDILACLLADALAGLMTYWDFEQEFGHMTDATENGGIRMKAELERCHMACKKLGARAKRFFGEDTWGTIVHSELGGNLVNLKSPKGAKVVRKSA